ncbi:MAG: polysaccharide deacetylase family protein [Planctomycetota bacterium]
MTPPAAPHPAVVTTSWDDGHPADRRLADLLEKYGVPATFYIPRENPLDDLPVMSCSGIRDLAGRGFEIGGHTLSHAVLTTLDDTEAQREIADCRDFVQDLTGQPCAVFSPPNGKHHVRHIEMIRRSGFDGYRTVEMWSLDRPRHQTNGLLEMPTTLTALAQPVIGVAKNLVKRRAVRGMARYLRRGLTGSWAEHAAAMLDRAVATGGVFHLWGHSWELDDFDQWDELEGVLQRITDLAAAGRVRLLSNGELCTTEGGRATDGVASVTHPK